MKRECPGLPADWLNAWLAAIGATVLVEGLTLGWTNNVVPHAVLTLPGDRDPAETLQAQMMAIDISDWPIERGLVGCEAVGLNLTIEQFRERANVARKHLNGWCLSSFYADGVIDQKRNVMVDKTPFLPGMPGKANTPSDRIAALLSSRDDFDVDATLRGFGHRQQANGLGFDAERIGSAGDDSQLFVEPVLEIMALFGLSLFPAHGARRQVRQRGWTGRKTARGSFRWPTWRYSLDSAAIDAFLDNWHAAKPSAEATSVFEVVPYQARGSNDTTRGFASHRVQHGS